jgi:hypothetical protein
MKIRNMKKLITKAGLISILVFFMSVISCTGKSDSPSDERFRAYSRLIPQLQVQGTAKRLEVGGKPMLMIAGELHNSTAGGLKSMRGVWEKLAAKNLNTVIATVSWELIEPVEGKYDFTLVDSMLAGARKANLKLVLIWFGSWKNASSVYIPSWVKRDYIKYPRAKDETGKSLEIISTFSEAAMKADARAFSALMQYIRKVDTGYHTVLMMQVENEVGVLDNLEAYPGSARRDFSEPANVAFKGDVPKELMEYLEANRKILHPELQIIWAENGNKMSGSWEEVFGKSGLKTSPEDWKFYSSYTEELFMAWNYSRYINTVAEAGKKEYPIPMYVNAWLKQPFSFYPGKYPSGGPLPQVLDVWRAGAPSIDFIAPDIYTDEFRWVIQEFTRSSNPLFIPEIGGGSNSGPRALYAIGEYNAACFSPFAIDDPRYAENDPFTETYGILNKMAPVILSNQGTGSMRGILVDTANPVQRFDMGDFHIEARLNRSNNTSIAGGIIIQTGKEEFTCAASAMDIYFVTKNDSMRTAVEAADEGTFEKGIWITERRLNGDEVLASTWSGTGLIFPANRLGMQRISLYLYR